MGFLTSLRQLGHLTVLLTLWLRVLSILISFSLTVSSSASSLSLTCVNCEPWLDIPPRQFSASSVIFTFRVRVPSGERRSLIEQRLREDFVFLVI